ncbi:hypothetical protein LOCC1_G008329 [Lachnellula occidentalis]|uniref:Uncharacterized protein n=1 Tax=Lachnellula occidentalis TaxID=215460 RepID=A0A8H8U2U2_9HELO|nr:hypothetical protein LOCC1_G008329 [Lachnellula occidentalis]
MIGRADIEGSKSNVAMNAWLPQASSVLPTRPFWTECLQLRRPLGLDRALSPAGVARTLSSKEPTPYRALNRFLPPLGHRVSPGVSVLHASREFPVIQNPCGNFSGTSSLKFRGTKGSIGHTFMVCIHTENQNQGDFYPFVLLEISVLHESPLGHLRYGLTDVPPQPNSPPDNVFNPDQPAKDLNARSWALTPSSALLNK